MEEHNLGIILIAMSSLFIFCQSFKIIPDLYEIIHCNHVGSLGDNCEFAPVSSLPVQLFVLGRYVVILHTCKNCAIIIIIINPINRQSTYKKISIPILTYLRYLFTPYMQYCITIPNFKIVYNYFQKCRNRMYLKIIIFILANSKCSRLFLIILMEIGTS